MATFSHGIHCLTLFHLGLLMGIIPRGGGSLIPSSYQTNAIGESNEILLPLSSPPCPDSESIFPCVCSYEKDQGSMDMDCSNVTGQEELRQIFSQNITFTNFRRLIINENKNITILKDGDLGNASFTQIYFTGGSLTKIEDLAMMGSWDTLIELRITGNELTSLHDIWPFTRLTYLELTSNKFTQFPLLKSTTLTDLDIGANSIGTIQFDPLKALPSLSLLFIFDNPLHEIYSGTFTGNERLNSINLGNCLLTTIPKDAIHLHGDTTSLFLPHNQLTSIPLEVVSDVTYQLDVSDNQLSELPENVYKPLLEKGVDVFLNENPFLCGCDMAWLIENQTLLMTLPHVDDNDGIEPTCSDGVRFIDLDPIEFHQKCDNATEGISSSL